MRRPVVQWLMILRAMMILFTAIPTFAATAPTTQPDMTQRCQALLASWRGRLDAERMSYLVAAPFVLAGDDGQRELQNYLHGTIAAAADAMHRQFFNAKPSEPILILLFDSEQPYRRLASQWFGDENVSHYGYFRHNNVMVMNIATGSGTLVHELTHALLRPDFPQVPDWFNEGLASLFEQCTLADGKIRGLTNWRLAGLQDAIRRHELRPLRQLIEDPNFYAADRVGINYAQARYLLMYLQQRGELESFYRQLRDNHATDPTGVAALAVTVAPLPLDEFDAAWQKWVMSLKFPDD